MNSSTHDGVLDVHFILNVGFCIEIFQVFKVLSKHVKPSECKIINYFILLIYFPFLPFTSLPLPLPLPLLLFILYYTILYYMFKP